jgi:uncharacterized DUF497 family protein
MNITKHALERMAERGFTPEMLVALMEGKHFIKTGNDGRFVVIGQVDEKIWAVVFDSDLYTVITVRRAHRDEEALWTSR